MTIKHKCHKLGTRQIFLACIVNMLVSNSYTLAGGLGGGLGLLSIESTGASLTSGDSGRSVGWSWVEGADSLCSNVNIISHIR